MWLFFCNAIPYTGWIREHYTSPVGPNLTGPLGSTEITPILFLRECELLVIW